jgi:hypothetical protein
MTTLFIFEKPSVMSDVAKAVGLSGSRSDGYIDAGGIVFTFAIGHLVRDKTPDEIDPAWHQRIGCGTRAVPICLTAGSTCLACETILGIDRLRQRTSMRIQRTISDTMKRIQSIALVGLSYAEKVVRGQMIRIFAVVDCA